MTEWFGAMSNQGVVASVEFTLSRMSEATEKGGRSTDRKEDLFETRSRPNDGHDAVIDLSLRGVS